MLDNPLDDLAIEVVAAEMVVAVARDHLDDAFLDPNDRHVECSAAEIVDQETFALLLRGLIDQRRRRRLIDDAHHFQPGDLAGGARRLPLRVGEKGRHGDHRLADRPPEPLFGDFLEALQNDRRDFLRRVLLFSEMDLAIAAHQALDRTHGAVGIEDILVARLLADEEFSRLVHSDDGRQDDASALIRQHVRPAVAVERDLGICRSKINADDLFVHRASPRSARLAALVVLATVTSAGRNNSFSHSNPGRHSATTTPSATAGSSIVATTRARAGVNGRPTVAIGVTPRSAST